MTVVLLLSGAVLVALAWLFGLPAWRRHRRAALLHRPIPPQWSTWLQLHLRSYEALPADLRERLLRFIQVFLAEKQFVGCNGLAITDEIRVAIAGHASLLVLNRPEAPERHFYDELAAILVYPTPFIVPQSHHDEDGLVSEHEDVLSGQAWDAHRILLSWEDMQHAAELGQNVALHEFAHYLDLEDETMDGAPGLGDRAAYEAWSQTFRAAFDQLREDVDAGRDTFLDPYAAEEPAEFFAVATEAFFDEPCELAATHPALYEQLRRYYRLDPAAWVSVGDG